MPAPPAVGHVAHRAFPENTLIYPRLNVKVLRKLFQKLAGWGAEPFLAHRNGRNPPDSQKLRREGQTVHRTVWPWGTLARGSPSFLRLCNCEKKLLGHGRNTAPFCFLSARREEVLLPNVDTRPLRTENRQNKRRPRSTQVVYSRDACMLSIGYPPITGEKR